MGKEKRKDEQVAQNTEKFERKYRTILDELKQMPREDQKLGKDSARWRWFRQQPYYEVMVMDLPRCLPALTRKNGVDSVVLMETLIECVNTFIGVNKEGKEYTFTQSINNRYKQLAGHAASKEYLQMAGMTLQTRDARIPMLVKLIKEVRTVIVARGSGWNWNDLDSVLEGCLKTSKYTYSREEIREARSLIENLNIVSVDSIPGDEDGVSMEEIIPGGEDPAERIDEGDDRMDALGCLGKQWDTVVASTFKTDRNLLKAFLSRDVLVELKLRRLSRDELSQLKRDKSADYIKELEPLCRKWCPTRNTCQLSQNYGCYIRWGRLSRTEPPGDWEVYQMLNRDGEILYGNILNNDYVQYAYEQLPEEMYDLYANLLKDFGRGENTFEFTDTVMATALGLRKDTVSKGRKKYEGEVRSFIKEQFLK